MGFGEALSQEHSFRILGTWAEVVLVHQSWLTGCRADVREVDRDTLEPILFLLQSSDIEVQRAASAALGNLAVNSKLFEMSGFKRSI